jgi:hypothetical protein
MRIIPDSQQLKRQRNEKLSRKFRKSFVILGVVLLTVVSSRALAEAVKIQSIDLEKRDFSMQENIVIDTGMYDATAPKVELQDADGQIIPAEFTQTEDGKIKIKNPET